MDVHDAITTRRMRRDFTAQPVPIAEVDRLCDLARRAPSAGNSQGVDFVVLEGEDQTERYWSVTLAEHKRARFGWPGLLRAPVLIVVVASPGAYLARYSEPDKAASGLGDQVTQWDVPFWHVDAGMSIQNLLLAAHSAGLGACFFGVFSHAPAIADALDIPDDKVVVGTVAVGYATGADAPGRSAKRARRALASVMHRGRW